MKLCALVLFAFLPGTIKAQVTFDSLLHADEEPKKRLTYSGTYASHPYSLLTQINSKNVASTDACPHRRNSSPAGRMHTL